MVTPSILPCVLTPSCARKIRLASLAWVLPLVLLVSGLAQSAVMFCSMQGAVMTSGCCCHSSSPKIDVSEEPAFAPEVKSQDCCDVVASAPQATFAVLLPNFAFDPPVPLPALRWWMFVSPALPKPSASAVFVGPLRPPQSPLIVLKHAFLI